MLKEITIIILLGFVNSFSFAQENISYDSAVKEFYKTEIKLIKYRKAKNNNYAEPIETFEHKLNMFKKNSNNIISKTSTYSNHLLEMLIDKKLKKDSLTNEDIVFVAYNLCINDYVVFMRGVFESYKNNKIDFKTFSFAVHQEYVFANTLIKNYQNPDLKKLYSEIMQYLKIKNNKDTLVLNYKIYQTIMGDRLKEYLEVEKIQPSIIYSCN